MDKETEIKLKPIGVIRSPFVYPREVPIQPAFASATPGTVEVLKEFAPALKDLDGFSHIVLVYYFDRAGEPLLVRRPFMDREEHGLFAMRHPDRPNPIGISVVGLRSVEGNVLNVEGIDVLDETPLLDIKPFVPDFRSPGRVRVGWLEGKGKSNEPRIRGDHED